MKRILALILAVSFLHAQELEEAIPSEISLNELTEDKSPLVAVNEFGDFKGEMAELSFKENEPLLSVTEPKKNGLYFFVPLNLKAFFLPGFSFRHELNNRNFLEVSYFNRKQAEIGLFKGDDLSQSNMIEKLGSIYENVVSASYGFKWITRFVDPYVSLGGGFYLPYVKYSETSYVDVMPVVGTALGLGFKYGFIDLAIDYLPIKWTGVFTYQREESEGTFEHNVRLLANLRLGLGFPF